MLRALGAGLSVLLYGNPAFASEKIRSLLGVEETEPISGDLTIETEMLKDTARDLPLPKRLRHIPLLSDGGVSEKPAAGGQAVYCAFVTDGVSRRVYACVNRHAGNGVLAWVRGSFPHDPEKSGALPEQLDKTVFFPAAAMLRAMLAPLGVTLRFAGETRKGDLPVVHVSMNDNALYVTGYAKDTTVRTLMSFPYGAPLMEGFECVLENDTSEYISPKWWHRRCRLFARQKERGVVSVVRRTAEHPILDERFLVTGLRDAVLTVCPPVGARVRIVRAEGSHMLSSTSEPMTVSPDGKTLTAEHLNGDFFIAWQSDHNPGCMLKENQMHPAKVTETRR